ncbi:MAG: O-antigen ligase family protein [Acidimicrobiales bacterium]
MPAALLDIIAIGGALVCARGPLRWAVVTLFAGLFLVPDALTLSFGPGSLTVLRLLLWASTAGLVGRAATGAVAWSALRPGRVHLALGGFVVMAYVVGVSLAPWPADFHAGINQWLLMVDQLLFLWCAVAFARILGVRWVATVAVLFACADAAVGVGERLTSASYAHWWYAHARPLPIPSIAGPLELRTIGGSVRVRGNAEFALQYGWVLAMVTPLACALAIEVTSLGTLVRWATAARDHAAPSTRWLIWAAPPLLIVATMLSVSRSVFVGLGLAAVVWLVATRFDRRVAVVVAGAGLIALALVVGVPSLRHPYHGAVPDSIESRVRRQQLVAAAVIRRPYTGVGLAGLVTYGIHGTDSMYVQTYGTLGVVGLVGLVAALVTPVVVGIRGALRRRGLIAAGAAAGVAAGIVAAGAFDSLSGPTSSWTLWLLAAIAVVAAEQAATPGPTGARRSPERRSIAGSDATVWGAAARVAPAARSVSASRLLVPIAGVALGLLAASTVGPRSTVVSDFVSLDARHLAPAGGGAAFAAAVSATTICEQGRQAVAAMPVSVVCLTHPSVGLGYLVMSGADRATVAAALARFDAAATEVAAPYARTALDRFDYRSTPLRTAPVWLGLGGALLVLLLPPLYRRPRAIRPRPLQRGLADA